jgi:wobble nucleotide-excising tRNase
MIESIDIPHFGSFRSFDWGTALRDDGNNVVKFRKMNILFGRNYSGKTTLSRVVRCLETGELPPRFEEADFTIRTSSGAIGAHALNDPPFHVRVYNRDFVAEHLSFLTDDRGQITPFAVIGRDNTEVERELQALEERLGAENSGSGLRSRLAEADKQNQAKTDRLRRAERELEKRLTAKATKKPHGLKHNTVFRDPNYNTPKIRADIATIRAKNLRVLPDKEQDRLRKLVSEEPLADLTWTHSFAGSFSKIQTATAGLLSRAVSPTTPIQELLENTALQAWVKAGIPLHRVLRASCGFCDQSLPTNHWDRMDGHFSREAAELERGIESALEDIKAERQATRAIPRAASDAFYETLRSPANDSLAQFDEAARQYLRQLDTLQRALDARRKDIFRPRDLPDVEDHTGDLLGSLSRLATLVRQHNEKTGSLSSDQRDARTQLRLSEVAQFIEDIDLEGEETKLGTKSQEVDTARSKAAGLRSEVVLLERQVINLKARLKDESQGAEKVNEYLNNYFGHGGLRLKAVDDPEEAGFKFQIFRGGKLAYNLSEGECSLVAFCYFVARLEASDTIDKDLIVFIDDPVSSLDENHIFFVFSLIQSIIARPARDEAGEPILGPDGEQTYRYRQLFVSTHNLDFLKYCKRLHRPKKGCEHFLVVAKEQGSVLELMPRHLREYVTEFNYLFDEIYICVDATNEATHLHAFYGFGNNLRRFLEAFLFFKYPFAADSGRDHKERIERFFGGDPAAESLVQRLTNEMSHLGERFDRSVQPVDNAEISKLARFVLLRLKKGDPAQFTCLLESVGKPDPFL